MGEALKQLETLAPRLKSAGLLEPCQALVSDNPGWEEADVHVLIVRLSPLRDMASSTGHLFLHHLVRRTLGPGAFIDFVFFPSATERKSLLQAGMPFLHGVFGGRGAIDYSAVLFSCSYAPELVNLPILLMNSGIPVRASGRQGTAPGGGTWPLMILGGSNALASQSLIFPDGDSFVDGIFFGEGEDGGDRLVRAIAESRGQAPGERARQIALATGSFWPAGSISGHEVQVARYRATYGEPILVDRYPVLNTEEASTARVQLSFGCPSTCTFCFEGWEHKPYREIDVDTVLAAARRLAANTGAGTLELYSFNFNAHADIGAIVIGLNRLFERVNMMSQRADLLVSTPGLLEMELAAEKTGFTIGVEGISDGMRALYSKGLSESCLRRLMERLAREKVREMKLFYILAGVEDDGDFAGFDAFCQFMSALRARNDRGLRVVFSFGYLVRMPFTPLRGLELCLDRSRLDAMAGRLKRTVEAAGFEFRLATDWDEYVVDQMLVLGPHEMAGALESAAAAGAAFDGTVDSRLKGHLEKAIREGGGFVQSALDGPFAGRKGEGYPWALDFLRTPVGAGELERRAADAMSRIERGTCVSGLEAGKGECLGCGACESEAETANLLDHRVVPVGPRQVAELAALIRSKRRMRPRYVRAFLPDALSGAGHEFLKAWLLGQVLSSQPELVGRLFRVEEAMWSSPELRDRFVAGMTGECVLALYGIDEDVPGEAPRLSDDAFGLARDTLGAAIGRDVVPIDSLQDISMADVVVRVIPAGDPGEQEVVGRVRAYLSDLKLNAIERRVDDGRLFEIAPKDQKKRVLKSVRVVSRSADGAAVVPAIILEGGPRLDLAPLFRHAGSQALTRIVVERLS